MSFFDKLKTNVHQTYVKTAEKIMPTLKDSKFLEEGVLTPEEFVAAGDLLTHKCPTWTWEPAEEGKSVSYLPKDKQMLLTRNVPCLMRLKTFEGEVNASTSVDVADVDGDWCAPSFGGSTSNADTSTAAAATSSGTDAAAPAAPSTADGNETDSDDIPDMEEFGEEENLGEAEDDAALPSTSGAASGSNDNIVRTRTYDLSITYDKYYQTPKLWLFGYDEARQPLKPEQLFEDISADHAQKTVTIDTHPHLSSAWLFIHPCKHSTVMKRIIERQVSNDVTPRADQYLFLFLKFISTVIPTIEYDYTQSVSME